MKKIRFRNQLWEIEDPKHFCYYLSLAYLIFPRLINHENRTISNEIDEIREYEEYRSNLDKCQELIPAVRVDEENETILPS